MASQNTPDGQRRAAAIAGELADLETTRQALYDELADLVLDRKASTKKAAELAGVARHTISSRFPARLADRDRAPA